MMLHLVLLVSLTTSAYSSNVFMVKNFKPGQHEPLCQFQGQFLLHGENRCKYIRCTYGPATVSDKNGEGSSSEAAEDGVSQYKVFYGVERSCPYGTAVSRNFYKERGYGHKQDDGFMLDESRLCTERIAQFHSKLGHLYYDQCLVETPRYIPYLPPQMFPALYHTDNQVPGSYPTSYPNNYGAHPINHGYYPGIIRFPGPPTYGYGPNAAVRPVVKATEPEVEEEEQEEQSEESEEAEPQAVYPPEEENQEQSEEQGDDEQQQVEQTVHVETPAVETQYTQGQTYNEDDN